MNYTTYLFDFDYTLADSSRGIVTLFPQRTDPSRIYRGDG